MNARVLVRASILTAVLGAAALFFAVGFRRVAPPPGPAAPVPQATQPAR